MTRLQELEAKALDLTDAERASFAAHLLQTLPAVLADEDEGVTEALRREREMLAEPQQGVSWEELKRSLGR